MKPYATIIGLCIPLLSCTSVPSLTTVDVGKFSDGSNVTVKDVTDHVRCEIFRAALQSEILRKDNYYVGTLLNLKVDDSGALTPSLSIIDPIHLGMAQTAAQSLSYGLGAQLSEAREHTFSQAIIYNVGAMFRPENKLQNDQDCGTAENPAKDEAREEGLHINGINLLGDLGIHDTVELGVNALSDHNQMGSDPPMETPAQVATGFVQPSAPATTTPAPYWPCKTSQPQQTCQPQPSFGATIQFSIVRAVGGGPNWVLTRFKGPGGGVTGTNSIAGNSASLLNFGRSDQHTLWLAFAPLPVAQPATELIDEIRQIDKALQSIAKSESLFRSPAERRTLDTERQSLQERKQALQSELKRGQPEASASQATAATQAIINTMILQNLQSFQTPP